MAEKKKKKGGCMAIILMVLASSLMAVIAVFYIVLANTLSIKAPQEFKINRGENLEEIVNRLETEAGLKHPEIFSMIAKEMNIHKLLKPCQIQLQPGMNKRSLALLIRQGLTKTVDIVIRGTFDIKNVPGFLAEKLAPEEDDFRLTLKSKSLFTEWGFNETDIYCVFVPNTYNVYYYAMADDFLIRMHREWTAYWNEERIARANAKGLSPKKVHILASIVDKETSKFDEMPKIAGVYLNRLKNSWPLQADPTVKFAMDSMSLKRIYKIHTRIESPFNTYNIQGLPPGPICIPSLQSIEAVLNAEDHKLMFFCARPDYSGYHVFSVGHIEHMINADRYHRFLDNEARKKK